MAAFNSFIKNVEKKYETARFYDADRLLFLFAISLLSARADFSGVNIIAVPLLAFAYLLGLPSLLSVSSGLLIGAMTVSTPAMLELLACISIFLFISMTIGIIKKINTQQKTQVAAPLAYGITGLIFMFVNNTTYWLPVLIGTIISFTLTHFFIKNIADFASRHQRYYKKTYPLFISSLIIIASFGIPPFFFINPPLIISSLLILYLIKSAGYQAALVQTVITATLFLFNGAPDSLFICVIASMALAGLVEDFPKITIAFFFCSSFLLGGYFLNYEVINNLLIINLLIATALFLLTDNKVFKLLQQRMPWMLAGYVDNQKRFFQARKRIGSKVSTTSELLEKIADEISKGENGRQIRQAMEEIYLNLCTNCPKVELCYQEKDKMVQLIPKAIIKGLNNKEISLIEDTCLKPAKLLTRIDEKRRVYSFEYKYAQEYQKLKELIGNQMKGLSRILYACQEEVESESEDILEQKSRLLSKQIDQLGYNVLFLHIHSKDDQLLIEGAIELPKSNLLEKEILPLLKKELFTDLQLVRVFRPRLDGYYRFQVKSHKKYYLTYGVSQIGKDFLNCGDTYRFFKGEQEVIMAISDGMGSGEGAAKQSQLSISLLEKMISSGMSSIEAIENLNLFLKIKNAVETFATIDIMSFNQRSGRAMFTKSGAYPSFIIRNKKVEKIDSSTAPIGIVDTLEVKSQTLSLQEGDVIVMMSDGVDGLISDPIENTLISLDDVDMQKMSGELLRLCQKSKTIKDDITIVCAKVAASTL